jgi:hypothetical protein
VILKRRKWTKGKEKTRKKPVLKEIQVRLHENKQDSAYRTLQQPDQRAKTWVFLRVSVFQPTL